MSPQTTVVETAGILEGRPRLAGTRIGVFTIGSLCRHQNWTIDEIQAHFVLTRPQIEAALAYYDANQARMRALRRQCHDRVGKE